MTGPEIIDQAARAAAPGFDMMPEQSDDERIVSKEMMRAKVRPLVLAILDALHHEIAAPRPENLGGSVGPAVPFTRDELCGLSELGEQLRGVPSHLSEEDE